MTINTRRNRVVVRLANLLLRAAGSEYRAALHDHIRAGLAMSASAAGVASVLRAAHTAADELDEWDGEASSSLGGCSPGGVVRHAVHEAAGLEVDTCPACNCICGPDYPDEPACPVHGYFAGAPDRPGSRRRRAS